MSYILDALRRSDQDRKNGEVPNLQSQPGSLVLSSSRPFESARRKLLRWLLFFLLAVVVLLGWVLSQSTNTESRGISGTGTTIDTDKIRSMDEVPTIATQHARQEQVSSNDLDLDELRDLQLDVSPVDEPELHIAQATASGPPPAKTTDSLDAITGEREARDDSPQVSAQSAPQVDEPISSTEISDSDVDPYKGIPHQRQLAYALQRAVPELIVSVHVYSTKPSSRLVRINNTIYREGDIIDNELKLEEITQDGLIMSVRDNLFWRHVR